MKKPKLVVMAAGLGSRYGGLKQMESVTPQNEIILDFACYDAWKAGFEEIVFIIKPEMEEDFRERVLSRMEKYVKCSYVFQQIGQLPEGFSVPDGRTKPWGTCHAVMAAKELLDGPFAVINADDYYGRDAFQKVFDFLSAETDENRYCMAGYYVENTLSEQGTVTRGVCATDENGLLTAIDETKNIGWKDPQAGTICAFEEKTGETRDIPRGTVVSMNFWGFQPSMMDYMLRDFDKFLREDAVKNPMKAEYLLPIEVGALLERGTVSVQVLEATDKWYGVTYKEDRDAVRQELKKKVESGEYPCPLWK